MAQVVYGLTRDLGDGSACISWFRDKKVVDRILNGSDEDFIDDFAMNDCVTETLTFPDDLDLTTCGFSFSDDIYEAR